MKIKSEVIVIFRLRDDVQVKIDYTQLKQGLGSIKYLGENFNEIKE